MYIDRSDYHEQSVEECGLPLENAGTHIGMFFTWLIDNDLLGELHTQDETSRQYIQSVKNREKTGRDFFTEMCDTKFCDEDLNELGLQFTTDYYENSNSKFAKKYGNYLQDYAGIFMDDNGEIYNVDNSWEEYAWIAEIINERFIQWQEFSAKPKWKFW